jgi:hypothetical protein
MATSKVVYYSLYACKDPPILMGDNSSVEDTGKGRIELTNGSFENVLFRIQGISLVIQLILGRLDLISRSLRLHSLPLSHFPPSIFSWFSLHIHGLMARLLEIPFGNLPCRRSTTPSSRTILGIWFPFLLGGNLSDADRSTGPRSQQMDRLVDTNPGLFPKAFSSCMVLTMMRPSLQ